MQTNDPNRNIPDLADTSISGYVTDSFEGISRNFTDFHTLEGVSATNVTFTAKRYGRKWFIKGLKSGLRADEGQRQRLRKEFEIMTLLQHPGVATAFSLEEVDGLGPCIIMEFIDGTTLAEWLKSNPTKEERKHIISQLLDAVRYMHTAGVVHRDLKPANIMVTRNGHNVKIVDFGLADTDSHSVLKSPGGTPAYMSPEQAVQPVADVRNDIYSLGKIIVGIMPGWKRIVKRCQLPVSSRYQTVAELQHDISVNGRRRWWNVAFFSAAIIIAAVILTLILRLSHDKAESDTPDKSVATPQDSIFSVPAENTDVESDSPKQENQPSASETVPASGKEVRELDGFIADGITQLTTYFMTQCPWKLHMDTLSDIKYLDKSLSVHDYWNQYNSYIDGLRPRLTNTEIAVVESAISSGMQSKLLKVNNKLVELMNKHNSQLKQKEKENER